MNKKWMKMLALLLALCTVLSLAVPAASAEENGETAATTEEEFVFPEFGDAYSLGEVLTGGMQLTEYALLLEKDGKQYLMASAKGGTLYVLKLSEYLNGNDGGGTFIEAAVNHGIAIPRCIVMDSQGVSYTVGDASYVFCYDFYKNTTARINIPAGSRALTIDKDDNLYVGTEGSGASQIIKIDLKNNNKQTVLYETNDVTGIGAVQWGTNGDLYMWGKRTGYTDGVNIYRIDTNTGAVKAQYTNETNGYGYYLSYIDGVLFGGHSSALKGLHAYDGDTLQPIQIEGLPDSWIMGVVTDPTEDGKSYMQISGEGIWEYDTKTRTAKQVQGLNSWNINLRIRDPYLDVNYDGITGKCLVTMASGHGLPSVLSLEGHGFRELEPVVEETTSPANVRSVAAAVPGVKVVHSNANALTSTPQEAAVYVGAYLSGAVAAYYPGAAAPEVRIDSQVFSNGHAQTDALLVYKNKLYAGCYSGGYLVQYDPATDEEIQMIPEGLKGEYSQLRIHGLSAGDDKIFFSSVPGDQTLGGVIGWIDLIKFEAGAPIEEYMYVERNVVPDQSVISIAYDEERNLLFGASSTYGGTNTTDIRTQDQAKMLVYDVDNKKVLGNFSVMSSENPHSDMVFDLTGKDSQDKLPEFISGIAQDPDTGKFWGIVSKTIFSFEYDEKTNALKIHEEVAVGNNTKGYYAIGGSLQWFPRPFCFDGKGNFYLWIPGGSIYRFNTSDPTDKLEISNDVVGRMYSLGTDGNLYVGSGAELYKIALNRVDIVKGMIDGVEPRYRDQVAIARKSYEALTDEEKAQIDEEYIEGLEALEGAAKIFLQVEADKAINAIDAIGAVTVSSQGALAKARTEYEFLNEEGKALVTNYQLLQDSEAAYEEISAASSWNRLKQIQMNFSKANNSRIGDTPLQMTTFDHITGGVWEYGLSPASANAMKYNGGDHLQLNFGGGWIAFRVRINEPGLYTIILNCKGFDKSVHDGGLYMFNATGIKSDHLYDLINNEATLKTRNTQHYICDVDYSVAGETEQGTWYCETAGEYLMVLNNLDSSTGVYGHPISFTFTKRDPNPDAGVELAKERINAIGKVNKNSGDKINDARLTYDALTDAQKALIYAPQLEAAELAFEEIKKQQAENDSKNAVDAAMVKAYIDAIGTVTEKSGPAIKMAREEYNKLSEEAKELVTNENVLRAAEEAFAKFDQGDDQDEGGSNALTYVLIGAGALVVILVVVLIVAKSKKKKAPEAAAEETADEVAATEEAPVEE